MYNVQFIYLIQFYIIMMLTLESVILTLLDEFWIVYIHPLGFYQYMKWCDIIRGDYQGYSFNQSITTNKP